MFELPNCSSRARYFEDRKTSRRRRSFNTLTRSKIWTPKKMNAPFTSPLLVDLVSKIEQVSTLVSFSFLFATRTGTWEKKNSNCVNHLFRGFPLQSFEFYTYASSYGSCQRRGEKKKSQLNRPVNGRREPHHHLLLSLFLGWAEMSFDCFTQTAI